MVNFQIVDILSDDIPNDKNGKEFQVTIYGKTDDHKTIVCNVIGLSKYCIFHVFPYKCRVPSTISNSFTSTS